MYVRNNNKPIKQYKPPRVEKRKSNKKAFELLTKLENMTYKIASEKSLEEPGIIKEALDDAIDAIKSIKEIKGTGFLKTDLTSAISKCVKHLKDTDIFQGENKDKGISLFKTVLELDFTKETSETKQVLKAKTDFIEQQLTKLVDKKDFETINSLIRDNIEYFSKQENEGLIENILQKTLTAYDTLEGNEKDTAHSLLYTLQKDFGAIERLINEDATFLDINKGLIEKVLVKALNSYATLDAPKENIKSLLTTILDKSPTFLTDKIEYLLTPINITESFEKIILINDEELINIVLTHADKEKLEQCDALHFAALYQSDNVISKMLSSINFKYLHTDERCLRSDDGYHTYTPLQYSLRNGNIFSENRFIPDAFQYPAPKDESGNIRYRNAEQKAKTIALLLNYNKGENELKEFLEGFSPTFLLEPLAKYIVDHNCTNILTALNERKEDGLSKAIKTNLTKLKIAIFDYARKKDTEDSKVITKEMAKSLNSKESIYELVSADRVDILKDLLNHLPEQEMQRYLDGQELEPISYKINFGDYRLLKIAIENKKMDMINFLLDQNTCDPTYVSEDFNPNEPESVDNSFRTLFETCAQDHKFLKKHGKSLGKRLLVKMKEQESLSQDTIDILKRITADGSTQTAFKFFSDCANKLSDKHQDIKKLFSDKNSESSFASAVKKK